MLRQCTLQGSSAYMGYLIHLFSLQAYQRARIHESSRLRAVAPISFVAREEMSVLWFNFILGSNFLFFCFKLIIMLLSYITIPKNKRKENLNQG